MLPYGIQWLYSVIDWSVSIQSNYILLLNAGVDIFNYALHREIPYYASITFVGSIFVFAMSCFPHIAISPCSVIALHIVRASIILSTEKVFWIPFSSIVTVSDVLDITLNGWRALAVISSEVHLPFLLIQIFASAVCQRRSVVQGKIWPGVGQFSPSCAYSVPWQSQVSRPLVCRERTAFTRNNVDVGVLSCHLVLSWLGFPCSGPVAKATLISSIVWCPSIGKPACCTRTSAAAILVPVVLMLSKKVSEACSDCPVELLHMPIGLAVIDNCR